MEDEEHEEEGRVWRRMKSRKMGRRRTKAEMLQETGELRPKLV